MDTKTGIQQSAVEADDMAPSYSSRDMMEKFLAQYMAGGLLNEDFKSLTPWQRIQIFQRLSGFVMPKIKAVEIDMHSSEIASTQMSAMLIGLYTNSSKTESTL